MWRILRPFEFKQTHGASLGQDLYDPNIKEYVLESMRVHTKDFLVGDDRDEILSRVI